MTESIEFVLTCDICGARVVSEHSLQEAKTDARRRWWDVYQNEAYCPDCHRPIPEIVKATIRQ